MKRLFISFLFLLNLCVVIDDNCMLRISSSEIRAQHMELEGGKYDCLDELYGWYKSPIPCDGLIVEPDKTYAECSYCHEQFSGSEIMDHEYNCPERHKQGEDPWDPKGSGGNPYGGGGGGDGTGGSPNGNGNSNGNVNSGDGNGNNNGNSSGGSVSIYIPGIKDPDVPPSTPIGSLAAAMAGYVYKDKYIDKYSNKIRGWTLASQELKDGLKNNYGMIFEHSNGYESELFVKMEGNEIKGYVLAFAGTDPLSINDIKNDLDNWLNCCAEQYKMALNMAYKLHIYAGETDVTFVGHSLGGGLAALSSMYTGRVAITFNAASVADVWKDLLINYDFYSGTDYIWNYVTDNDWLTPLQEEWGRDAEGTKIVVPHGTNEGGHEILNLMEILTIYMK